VCEAHCLSRRVPLDAISSLRVDACTLSPSFRPRCSSTWSCWQIVGVSLQPWRRQLRFAPRRQDDGGSCTGLPGETFQRLMQSAPAPITRPSLRESSHTGKSSIGAPTPANSTSMKPPKDARSHLETFSGTRRELLRNLGDHPQDFVPMLPQAP
jgi:hypothetical protein